MKYLLSIIALVCCFESGAQPSLNLKLKHDLDSIQVLDQKFRQLMNAKGERKDSIAAVYQVKVHEFDSYLWAQQDKLDSMNIVAIEA